MKRPISHNFNLLWLPFCFLFAFSCAKGPGPNDMIKLSQDEILFGAEGGIKVITSNMAIYFDSIYYFDEHGSRQVVVRKESYEMMADESIEYDWIKVSRKDADNIHSLTFEAQPNDSGFERKLYVSIVRSSFDVTEKILVRQSARQ